MLRQLTNKGIPLLSVTVGYPYLEKVLATGPGNANAYLELSNKLSILKMPTILDALRVVTIVEVILATHTLSLIHTTPPIVTMTSIS